jgi:hypothetical protein
MAGDDNDPLRIASVTQLGPASAAAATDAVEAVTAPTGEAMATDAVDAVAASLAAGAIDPAGALGELVHAQVAAVVGPGDAAALAGIEAEVAGLLADDPTLADLLRR